MLQEVFQTVVNLFLFLPDIIIFGFPLQHHLQPSSKATPLLVGP